MRLSGDCSKYTTRRFPLVRACSDVLTVLVDLVKGALRIGIAVVQCELFALYVGVEILH